MKNKPDEAGLRENHKEFIKNNRLILNLVVRNIMYLPKKLASLH